MKIDINELSDYMEGTIVSAIEKVNHKGHKYFTYFGIHKNTLSVYGRNESDIINLNLSIHKNQTKPEWNQMTSEEKMVPDYWAFFRYKNNKWNLIESSWILFTIQFPYGYEAEEACGDGKAYRIKLEKV